MHKQTNGMKTYQRPRQYIYHPCQPGRVAPGLGLLVSVCILMLPMLVLVDEHVQLTITCRMSRTKQFHAYLHHTTCPGSLVLPSLGNILPAMVLQNRRVRSNMRCPLYTLSYSGVCHVSPNLNLLSGLARRVVGVVLALLLLLSGDIESNPGPIGEFLC